jgi:hypothetical protein
VLVDIDVPVKRRRARSRRRCRERSTRGGLVIAAGSVFLAGAVRDILGAR